MRCAPRTFRVASSEEDAAIRSPPTPPHARGSFAPRAKIVCVRAYPRFALCPRGLSPVPPRHAGGVARLSTSLHQQAHGSFCRIHCLPPPFPYIWNSLFSCLQCFLFLTPCSGRVFFKKNIIFYCYSPRRSRCTFSSLSLSPASLRGEGKLLRAKDHVVKKSSESRKQLDSLACTRALLGRGNRAPPKERGRGRKKERERKKGGRKLQLGGKQEGSRRSSSKLASQTLFAPTSSAASRRPSPSCAPLHCCRASDSRCKSSSVSFFTWQPETPLLPPPASTPLPHRIACRCSWEKSLLGSWTTSSRRGACRAPP